MSIEGAAILQGFPSWYEFPNETATAGSIIGYSVPLSFATQLFMSAQSIIARSKSMTNRKRVRASVPLDSSVTGAVV
nr:DNA cytosine methyltransferase [Nostoc sp. UIC 10630]